MKNLKTQFALVLCIIIAIACTGLGFTSYFMSRQSITLSVENNLKVIADKSAQLLEEKVNTELGKLEVMAGRTRVKDPSNTIEDKLNALREEVDRNGYQTMSFIDQNGRGVDTSGHTFDLSERKYFKKALNGESIISDIIVNRMDGSSYVIYSTPVRYNGEITGVLAAVKQAGDFNELVSAITIGETGYAYAINNKGMIVAHKDTSQVSNVNILDQVKEDKDLHDLEALLHKMIAREHGSGSYTYEGIKKMMGYSPINRTNWSIGITVPMDEVLSDLRLLKTSMIVLFALIIVLSIIASYIFITKSKSPK